jgi:chromosome segregation ATPase
MRDEIQKIKYMERGESRDVLVAAVKQKLAQEIKELKNLELLVEDITTKKSEDIDVLEDKLCEIDCDLHGIDLAIFTLELDLKELENEQARLEADKEEIKKRLEELMT